MAYNRSETVDPSAGGDTVKEAILDLDSDMDNIFTYLNAHDVAVTAVHGLAGNVVGTSDTQTLTNKTLTAPDINAGTVDLITSLTIANNVDVGDYNIRAKIFQSDVPTGTAALIIASTTMIDNLNADMLDGQDAPTGSIVGTSDTQVLTNKTLTSPVLNTSLSGTAFLDEDNMASNSAVKVASQQSIKAYVDTYGLVNNTSPQLGGDLDLNGNSIDFPTTANISDCLDEDDMVSDSATKICTQQSIKAYVDGLAGSGAGLPTADHTYNGEVISATVDTNAYGLFATLYMASDGNFDEADADAEATMPCVALAAETGTGTKDVILRGYVRDDTWNWTPGGLIYVSTTQGGLTQTAPSGPSDVVQVVGWAWSADIIVFEPSLVLVVV
jgi:hypothetical protein